MILLTLLTAVSANSAVLDYPELPVERFRLANGLQVVLHESHRLPVVAVNVWYHTGASDETAPQAGITHLFEHLMFQGSEHTEKHGNVFDLLNEAGATGINGTTNFDRINFYATVPSHQLALALWVESDRMGFLTVGLDQKRLDTQRKVVKNEFRQSQSRPLSKSQDRLTAAVFASGHPYHHPVIGSHGTLDSLTVADLRAFYARHFVPSNASLVIAGDIDPKSTKRLVQRYFGSLPKRPRPKSTRPSPTRLRSTVRETVREAVPTPTVQVAWPSPAIFDNGDAAADITSRILVHGRSGRLHRSLVEREGLAESVRAYQASNGLGSSFVISATARPRVRADQLERALLAAVAELRARPPSPDEVERARRVLTTQFVSDLQGIGRLADRLNSYVFYRDDPAFFQRDLARYEKVRPSDVKRFARETLLPDAKVVVTTVPEAP